MAALTQNLMLSINCSSSMASGVDQVAVEHLPSNSTSMGERGLLCMSASLDGQVLAASGQSPHKADIKS